jgi:hypothetical protein
MTTQQSIEHALSDTERVLCEFWTELLHIQVASANDHLIELGGNSLTATMLANRIEFAWGFRPSLEVLLTSSLGELCRLCERARAAKPARRHGSIDRR